MSPITLLTPDVVFAHLEDASKKQALKTLAIEAEKVTGLAASDIFSVVMDREHSGCTGMGEGVAIPHGRFENITKIHALFATLKKPVEFGSADGKPVDILLLLLTPSSDNTGHLKAMATISRLLRDEQVRSRVRAAKDSTQLYAALSVDRRRKKRD